MADQRGSLFVTIVDCTDLFIKSSGQSAYQEPFCILKLGDLEVRTNTVAISSAVAVLSPRWNQEFKLEADRSQTLKIQVLNKDVFQNDHFLGQIKLPILQLPPHSPEELNVKLKKSKGKGTGKGSLRLIVEWHPPVSKEEPEDRKHKTNQGGLGDAIARKLHLPKKAATGNNIPTAPNRKVFGKPIDSQKADVPLVLKLTLNVIESKGLDTEGVFRMSAPVSEVEALREQFESGKDVEWYSYDIHVIAGLIMSFLLTMPEPLMTFDLYDSLISTYETVQDIKQRKQLLRKLFSTLPPGNRVTMEAILAVLQRLSENSAVNKMDARNLGIVFGPAVLRRKTETPQQLIHDSPILIGLVSTMIGDVDYFTGRESKEAPVAAAAASAAAAAAAAPVSASPNVSAPVALTISHSHSISPPNIYSPMSLSAEKNPLSLSSGISQSQPISSPLSSSTSNARYQVAEAQISDEQREKAFSAAATAASALQAQMLKQTGASPNTKPNWTMAGKSPLTGGTKPAVPSAPLAAMRSERGQPTPFTAALGTNQGSSAGTPVQMITAKDLKKTVPKAPLPHTPPVDRRRVDEDEAMAEASPVATPEKPERPLSGKNLFKGLDRSTSGKSLDALAASPVGAVSSPSSSATSSSSSNKHARRESHGRKEKTSGKHHEKKEKGHGHLSSSAASPASTSPALTSASASAAGRSEEVQNLIDTLDQNSFESSFQREQKAAAMQAEQGGPKVLKFDQARRSIQLSLDALSELQAPTALSGGISPNSNTNISPRQIATAQPPPATDDADRPPSARRVPIPPPDDLPPLSLPEMLPPIDLPLPPVPVSPKPVSPRGAAITLAPVAPTPTASTASTPLSPPPARPLPSLPPQAGAPPAKAPMRPIAQTGAAPLAVPADPSAARHASPLRALPAIPKQAMSPIAPIATASTASISPSTSAALESSNGKNSRPVTPLVDPKPPTPTPGVNKELSTAVRVEPVKPVQPTKETVPSAPAKTPTAASGATTAPVPPVARTSTQSAAPAKSIPQLEQQVRRLSFTKAPDPHAEQLTRIYNILTADIEKTRGLISALIRDLNDGRLEDVVATTHLLKSLKKLLDAPPGSVNVSELLIDSGRQIQKPNLRDPETARRFQQFCTVAENTLTELLETLDDIGSGFYAEVYTVLDRQQQLARALSIAHMARDFHVVVTNFVEVTQAAPAHEESHVAVSAPVTSQTHPSAATGLPRSSASPRSTTAPSTPTAGAKMGSSFEADSVRVQLAQNAAELMSLFRGELARVFIIEEAVALAKVARNVKAILMMDAREAEYHNFDVPERPPLPPGAALSQGPYERMRLEAMSEMVRYSLADIERELTELGGRAAGMASAADIKPVVNVVRVAFAHLRAYLDQERRVAAPVPAAAAAATPAPAASSSYAEASSSPISAPLAAASSVPQLREQLAPAADNQQDDVDEAEERQRLDMLKRTALLVTTNVINNINYLIVELQSATRTPEIILQIARIASLIRKLMEGMALPSDWKALVAPPTSYTLQSDRDLHTLFSLCMSVFEEFKGFIFDVRTELQQCKEVPDAVAISTQISGFAKVAESYFQPL